MTIRVAVVDVHALFRRRVIGILKATEGIEVVGEGIHSTEAVDLVEQFFPDVLIMEWSAPSVAGSNVTQRLLALNPQLKILVLSVNEEEEALFDAIKQGALGYIIKTIDPDELVHAVRRVHCGEAVVPGNLALRIFSDMTNATQFTVEEGGIETLTAREMDVLKELITGAANKDIAARLYISENTVRIHVHNILDKLHMSNRVEAATFAMREGLLKE